MDGQPWLKDGDVVRVEIETLGAIENRVADDPGGTIIE
jgi:2-keto-4-pentenoate hydratase/2-oxohepta-3-ene-1,7-dioic acid hydratase in catechol pathway